MRGAHEIDVQQFADARGRLAAFEHGRPLPFTPVRTFVISDVPPGAHRAGHDTNYDEFLWMAVGACRAIVRQQKAQQDDERRFHLVAGGRGLHVPKGLWLDLFDFDPGSVLICVADSAYVPRS
jgi:hypothetical protein